MAACVTQATRSAFERLAWRERFNPNTRTSNRQAQRIPYSAPSWCDRVRTHWREMSAFQSTPEKCSRKNATTNRSEEGSWPKMANTSST